MSYALNTPEDGIALSPDGTILYYCPLTSQHLYSLPISVIGNFNLSQDEIARQVTYHGVKGYRYFTMIQPYQTNLVVKLK